MSAYPKQPQVPVAEPGTGHVPTGTGTPRIDGRAKVTGQARYAAEWPAEDLVHGVAVNSSIAKGRILGFDLDAALAVPGVLQVLTHLNRPHMRGAGVFYKDMTAPAGSPFRPLYDAQIRYSGQPVALVLAETFEAARHAAGLVDVRYEVEAHETNLGTSVERAREPRKMKADSPPRRRTRASRTRRSHTQRTAYRPISTAAWNTITRWSCSPAR